MSDRSRRRPNELAAAVAAFLRARLDDDEKTARRAGDGFRQIGETGVIVATDGDRAEECASTNWAGIAEHIVAHDPARVLRDIEATRGVLAMYDQMIADLEAPDLITSGMAPVTITVLTPVMCHLAKPWSDHPDYQADAWKPIA